MDDHLFILFLIFAGAALVSTLALYARQSLLVVYIVVGILLGPSVLGLVGDPAIIANMSEVGIIFLLFLLGTNLPPQKLLHLFRETTLVAGVSSLLFSAIGFGFALAFGFSLIESLLVGATMMFSSTIIGLKLLPTTVLHHQHTGEIIISILLLQDLVAILILMLLPAHGTANDLSMELVKLLLSLIGVVTFAWLFERFVLVKLIQRFDQIREYIFLMAIGWCLSMAELASLAGLSAESGAFIAGVVLATSPLALFIGESLKPLRDFFLIIFFFALGASFDLSIIQQVLLPATLLAALMMLAKPFIFKWLLVHFGEEAPRSMEIGVRLGQISEFSIFVAVLAWQLGVIGERASYIIQVSTLLTFILSSWFVVQRYPTPIAASEALRRD
ncbi:MAG TPA: cation:proton antiporter [Gammaproteobacteria bacterium]|nr:cation:proton antiporter [Gammaproteobacteria bacterium]